MTITGIGVAKAAMRSTIVPGAVGMRYDQLMCASAATPRSKPLDLPRDESAVDQRAEPRVHRRLAGDHRQIVDVVEGPHMLRRLRDPDLLASCDMQDLAAEAAVAEEPFTTS